MKLPEVDNRQRMDQLLRTFEFFERWTDKSKESHQQLITTYPMMDYTLP
jgi:hypothetical protein